MFGRLKNIFETDQIICNLKNNLEYNFILQEILFFFSRCHVVNFKFTEFVLLQNLQNEVVVL